MKKNSFTMNKPLYYRMLSDDLNMPLSPSVIGYERCNKSKIKVHLNKPYYILHIVIDGKGYVEYENFGVEITKNHCFLIEPNSNVTYYPDRSDPWTYFWIEMNGELAKKICDLIKFKDNQMNVQISNINEVIKNMIKIFDEKQYYLNQNSETLRIESLLLKIISLVISEEKDVTTTTKHSKKEEQVRAIVQYINNNFNSQELSIEKISKQFYFNPSYLNRMFKEYMGMPPLKYIISLRMRYSVKLLKSNKYTINQIAEMCGYKNQFYFSKEFKSFYNITPTKYKF